MGASNSSEVGRQSRPELLSALINIWLVINDGQILYLLYEDRFKPNELEIIVKFMESTPMVLLSSELDPLTQSDAAPYYQPPKRSRTPEAWELGMPANEPALAPFEFEGENRRIILKVSDDRIPAFRQDIVIPFNARDNPTVRKEWEIQLFRLMHPMHSYDYQQTYDPLFSAIEFTIYAELDDQLVPLWTVRSHHANLAKQEADIFLRNFVAAESNAPFPLRKIKRFFTDSSMILGTYAGYLEQKDYVKQLLRAASPEEKRSLTDALKAEKQFQKEIIQVLKTAPSTSRKNVPSYRSVNLSFSASGERSGSIRQGERSGSIPLPVEPRSRSYNSVPSDDITTRSRFNAWYV